MNDFSTPGVSNHYGIPSSPSNFIKPGKRPMSSMCPTIFTDENGDFVLAAGAAGGSKITLATSYVRFLWFINLILKCLVINLYCVLAILIMQSDFFNSKHLLSKFV